MAVKIIVANSFPVYLFSDTDKWSRLKKQSLWSWATYWSLFLYITLIIALYWIEDVYCKSGINLPVHFTCVLLYRFNILLHFPQSLILIHTEDCNFLCFDGVQSDIGSSTLLRNILPPSSGSKNKPSQYWTSSKHSRGNKVLCSFGMSVYTRQHGVTCFEAVLFIVTAVRASSTSLDSSNIFLRLVQWFIWLVTDWNIGIRFPVCKGISLSAPASVASPHSNEPSI
jgi:hypothetical protein